MAVPSPSGILVVHFGAIAAGEVVLNSPTSGLARRLRRRFCDAIAIEMEGAGVVNAGHLNGALPTLIVRGISDAADGDKYDSDRAGWRFTAAHHAAAL